LKEISCLAADLVNFDPEMLLIDPGKTPVNKLNKLIEGGFAQVSQVSQIDNLIKQEQKGKLL